MRDDDEILTYTCDRCGRDKRVRVPAGTDAKVHPRCCRYLMRVSTRTTLGGESPPLHSRAMRAAPTTWTCPCGTGRTLPPVTAVPRCPKCGQPMRWGLAGVRVEELGDDCLPPLPPGVRLAGGEGE